MSAAEQQKPARKPRKTAAQLRAERVDDENEQEAIINPAQESLFEGYLKSATLWRVVLPARVVNGKEYNGACFGVYVRNGYAIQAPPIARWMIGQSWEESILPWLRKNSAVGRPLATGERLEV